MKLYDATFAPSPRRVRMFLAEKGIAVPTVMLDMAKNEHLQDEYLRINPYGELPTLALDDGSYLTESIAICRYFESLHPAPPLFGQTAIEQANVEMWSLRLMFRMYVPATQVFRNTHKFWAGRVQQVPEYGELARGNVVTEFARLNERLASQPFVVGDRFTFADIVAYTTVDFGRPSNLRIQADQPHLKRWYDAIAARPSAKA